MSQTGGVRVKSLMIRLLTKLGKPDTEINSGLLHKSFSPLINSQKVINLVRGRNNSIILTP